VRRIRIVGSIRRESTASTSENRRHFIVISDMEAYHNGKEKGKASPEYQEETNFFIQMGILLLEFEVCSESIHNLPKKIACYNMEELEKWI
jgi:hypothetical protein